MINKVAYGHFHYPLADGVVTNDGKNYLEVATTRPETMLGDAAVAVHPDDERYKNLLGKMVILPLVNRPIPIIVDTYVDPEFGSGCVKITPAHDFNDYEVGKRHQLPLINIFDQRANILNCGQVFHQDGTINTEQQADIPENLQGVERFKARKLVIEAMQQLDLLGEIKPHQLKVPEGDRSAVPIEPLLTDQWYVKTKPYGRARYRSGRNGCHRICSRRLSEHVFFVDA